VHLDGNLPDNSIKLPGTTCTQSWARLF